MAYEIKFKALDGKVTEIRGFKWGYDYTSLDERVPEIKAYHQKKQKEYAEGGHNGNQGSMLTGAKKPGFKIRFGPKALANISSSKARATVNVLKTEPSS